MNQVLLMMGGSGERFGADRPKQFAEIEGMPVFAVIMRKYDRFAAISNIVLVCHPSWVDYAEKWARKVGVSKLAGIVAGGDTRSESIRNGLSKLLDFARDEDLILIHDVTHPYLDERACEAALHEAGRCGAATLGARQFDTVYRMDENGFLEAVVPREKVVSGASPEVFEFGLVRRMYESAPDDELERFTSAGAMALACGIPMKVVPTDLMNLKITHRGDLDLFQRLFRGYYYSEVEL